MTPWEAQVCREFLKNKESMLETRPFDHWTKRIVSMLFGILQAELNVEEEINGQKMEDEMEIKQ